MKNPILFNKKKNGKLWLWQNLFKLKLYILSFSYKVNIKKDNIYLKKSDDSIIYLKTFLWKWYIRLKWNWDSQKRIKSKRKKMINK